MDRTIAIDVSHLSKTYDSYRAVDDLSFQVYAGEIFGLLGPNGAGKSTTLRTLITLLHPTSGTATVMGYDTVRDADKVRTLIGYVPQERAIDRFLTGREHLQLLGALYHLTKEEAHRRTAHTGRTGGPCGPAGQDVFRWDEAQARYRLWIAA
jgi:ABC-2 type transport system ATP-binding protein